MIERMSMVVTNSNRHDHQRTTIKITCNHSLRSRETAFLWMEPTLVALISIRRILRAHSRASPLFRSSTVKPLIVTVSPTILVEVILQTSAVPANPTTTRTIRRSIRPSIVQMIGFHHNMAMTLSSNLAATSTRVTSSLIECTWRLIRARKVEGRLRRSRATLQILDVRTQATRKT